MAAIGNSPTQQAFTPAIDYFSGNGSTTAFTLSRPVASVAQVQVTIDNVAQNPSSAFTVSANTITFTSAPLSGTNNIYVYYTSPITQVIAPGQGTVNLTSLAGQQLSPVAVSDQANTSTGYFDLPVGTTAQRPSSPDAGASRFNSTTGFAEYWTGDQWVSYGTPSATSVTYLVVAGGGGGGSQEGGGGGAGGYRTSTLSVTPGTSYTVTIGGSGAGSPASYSANGTVGGDSVFSTITSAGGGGGDSASATGTLNGGSGGGGKFSTGGTGTSGQGNAGGTGISGGNYGGGGGGGASAVGANGTNGVGGNGGAGLNWQSLGTYYAGGGGGGVYLSGTPGSGGAGGGGNAGNTSTGNGFAGTVNTGGGGGGGTNIAAGGAGGGGNGGSGIVIISYSSAYKDATATGTYAKTTSGGNTIYTFTGSGTITF